MTQLRVPKRALPAWDRLTLALLTYAPPCVTDPDRWWSYDPDDIEAAAHGCRGCRVLAECAAYADAADEPSGVWAGVNRDLIQSKRQRRTA